MNATKAKELLLSVPKEDFIIGDFTDRKSKCCAVGHLVRLVSNNPNDYSLENCGLPILDIYPKDEDALAKDPKSQVAALAYKKAVKFLRDAGYSGHDWVLPDMAEVNNTTEINGYTEDNPKDRVIHLLDDMIAAGY